MMKPFFSPKTKKVLFFDWNHTLVDPNLSFRKHFVQLLDEFSGRWAHDSTWSSERIYRKYEKEWKRLRSARPNAKSDHLRHLSLKKTLQPYPFDLSEKFMRTFFRELRERQRKQPVFFPSTRAVLDTLNDKYKLALISNGGCSHMDALGMNKYFPEHHRFTASKYGVRKPNRALFQKALEEMGVKPEEAVMIGNSWRNDIRGALRSGIDAVWLKKGMSGPVRNKRGRIIVRIQSIGELPSLF